MENENVIRKFYESFARNDAAGMIECYDDEIEFFDPAFGTLKGFDAKNMWKMLIEKGQGKIKINAKNIEAAGEKGSADWVAEYEFSQTGRKVINNIHAEFEFKNGKIIRHIDNFDIWQWSKQALGLPGLLLGWSSFMQNKIRQNANAALREYSSKQQMKSQLDTDGFKRGEGERQG